MGRRLLLLIALLASLVVLGCWDSRRQLQHVLDDGYATTAQLTGAQYQRKMPLAADGWRPRFVEQALSVDLTWQGKDGKAHTYRKVPVSDSFERSIVNGDQVRLVTVPVKVLDDESAVPVITSDATARLNSLQSWLAATGYAALAAWAGFAALTLLQRRTAPVGVIAPERPAVPRRTFVGLALLVIGGFVAFSAWSDSQSTDAGARGGQETTADILSAASIPGKDGGRPTYTVQLAWKDGQGAVRHFGPTPISESLWNKITRNGELTVHQTAIRYRDDATPTRPFLIDDAPEASWPAQALMGGGLVLMILGAALFASGLRLMRRA